MKAFLLASLSIISTLAFTKTQIVEFDQAKEVKCRAEIKTLGCVTNGG